MVFKDVREYIRELDRLGLLVRVSRPMNKDTEICPLVRWQFQGLDTEERRGWLFENVIDSRGRNFDAKMAVSVIGASPRVYAVALGAENEGQIEEKWQRALEHPIEPVVVDSSKAPVKENIIKGKDIVKSGGVDKFPIPVVNPGTDPAAYFSAPIWITRDPGTGVYNAGTYRSQVKAPDRLGSTYLRAMMGGRTGSRRGLKESPWRRC